MALAAIELGAPGPHRLSRNRIARFFNDNDPKDRVSGSGVKYWLKKVIDPNFHPRKHGGRREGTFKLTEVEFMLVEVKLRLGFKRRPDRNLASVAASITTYINHYLRPATNAVRARQGLPLYPSDVLFTRRDMYRLFARWGWSAKVPVRVHLHKLRPDNIMRYINYAIAITWVPPARLKYLDEATYCARGLPLLSSPSFSALLDFLIKILLI